MNGSFVGRVQLVENETTLSQQHQISVIQQPVLFHVSPISVHTKNLLQTE